MSWTNYTCSYEEVKSLALMICLPIQVKRGSMRKEKGGKGFQINAAVVHVLLRMMQFTSWMGTAEVLGRAKPLLHSAD